jgi:hypothetical protein
MKMEEKGKMLTRVQSFSYARGVSPSQLMYSMGTMDNSTVLYTLDFLRGQILCSH